ncbi:MAG: hypothetical protein U0793_12315 [Gemmataceae bacterium]
MLARWLGCLVFLILPVPLLAGLGSINKGKIEDTHWVNVSSDMKGLKLPAGAMKLHFSKDGSLSWEIKEAKVLKGKYVLEAGDVVIFELDEEVSGAKIHKERIDIKEDRLTLSDATGKIVFERLKAPKE